MTTHNNMNTLSDQLRIVLIGRTGNGKSSTGNSLLHSRAAFLSMQSAASITEECQAKTGQWTDSNGRMKEIMVVDTPGFFYTNQNISNQMVEEKIASQIFDMTIPGVHAFLIILRIDRFSPEERNTVDFIKTIFGTGVEKYCIVIFTREDQLEEGQTVDDFISSSPALRQLVNICGNRKLAINNRLGGELLVRKTQQLQQMIQEMVNNNNRTYYTNEKYQQIVKKRKEEQELRDEIAREEERKKIEAEVKRQNEVISTRTEPRTIEVSRTITPILEEREKRIGGLGGLISINGSGYKTYTVHVGDRTTIVWREEQRKINTLRSGMEVFGDWTVIRQWSTTS